MGIRDPERYEGERPLHKDEFGVNGCKGRENNIVKNDKVDELQPDSDNRYRWQECDQGQGDQDENGVEDVARGFQFCSKSLHQAFRAFQADVKGTV